VDLTLANAGRDGYAEAAIPTMDVEAEETDQGINVLESQQRLAVYAGYLDPGSARDKASRLGCAESTLFARIEAAHYCLASWLSGKAREARERRQRVQALQQAARPVAPPMPAPKRRGRKRSFTE